MTATLYWTTRHCPADTALANLTGRWIILAASPDEYIVTTDPALPNRCYQFQAFDGTTELRWLADGSGGRAIWIAESPDPLPQPPTGSRAYLARLNARAVLWGQRTADPVHDGNSVWREARIGTARYPCPPAVGRYDRAVLHSVEYVAIADRHGNAAVVQHRLVRIDTVDLLADRT